MDDDNSYLQESDTLKDEYVPFDLVDEKGRTVGARVHIDRDVYIPHTDETRKSATWSVKPGTYYVAWVWPTRNTKRFRNRSEKWFPTYEEADEYINKTLARSRKRSEEKYA